MRWLSRLLGRSDAPLDDAGDMATQETVDEAVRPAEEDRQQAERAAEAAWETGMDDPDTGRR